MYLFNVDLMFFGDICTAKKEDEYCQLCCLESLTVLGH
jgi:hypothetical protein